MSNQLRLPVNTAHRGYSIWHSVDHDEFRRHVVALSRASHDVPADPRVYTRDEWQRPRNAREGPSHILPFDVEQQLADGIAVVAAAEEGARAVSAVCLEEESDPPGLVLRLAANDTIPDQVAETLVKMFGQLEKCARRSSCNPWLKIFPCLTSTSNSAVLPFVQSESLCSYGRFEPPENSWSTPICSLGATVVLSIQDARTPLPGGPESCSITAEKLVKLSTYQPEFNSKARRFVRLVSKCRQLHGGNGR